MTQAGRHLAASAVLAAAATGVATVLMRETEPVAPLLQNSAASELARSAAQMLSLSPGTEQAALIAAGITGALALPVMLSAAVAERQRERVRWCTMPAQGPVQQAEPSSKVYQLASRTRSAQNGVSSSAGDRQSFGGFQLPDPRPGWLPDAVAGQLRWWDGEHLTDRVVAF